MMSSAHRIFPSRLNALLLLKIFIDMFQYAYNLDTEHLVIQMITSMLNFIGYLTVFVIHQHPYV